MKKQVLILSRSENVHADAIAEGCAAQGAVVRRINFDFEKLNLEAFPHVVLGDITEDLPDAVFIHHPRITYQEQWFQDEIERRLFVASWDTQKEWLEAQVPLVRWVNRPSATLRSKNLLGQLTIAQGLGMHTPKTLFTNDLARLREFAGDSRVVIKQGNLGIHIDKKRILTNMIDVRSLETSGLRGCPCLFQKYIDKAFELRVHVIGETVLTCKIESQQSEKTRIDWRDYDLENTPHAVYELDAKTASQCVAVTKALGLDFGTIDLIVTPEGEIVFLECNSQGHWAWIEKLVGLPITQTLCNHLLNGSALC